MKFNQLLLLLNIYIKASAQPHEINTCTTSMLWTGLGIGFATALLLLFGLAVIVYIVRSRTNLLNWTKGI